MSALFGRGRAASAVPVPRDDHPEPYGRKSLELVGSAVFATLTTKVPQERHTFEQLLKEFDADPQKLATRGRGPAIGWGVSIADLPVYVLPAVAWVLGVVGERVTGRATDALSEAVRGKAAVLMGRLRQRGAEPLEESAPAVEPQAAWSADERAAFVTAFQILFVQRLGLEADPAEALAEAIATALDDPSQGDAGS